MSESLPLVAVITRTANRPAFLERAMQSVLAQSLPDWVHVVVNDGGDPAPVDLLASAYRQAYRGRLIVIHHPASRGMQAASNAGLHASSSSFVTIHDDDDSWHPDFLTATTRFLLELGPDDNCQGVVTQTLQILEEVSPSGDFIELERRPYHPFAFVNLEEMSRRNLYAPIAFLYRRKVHEEVGDFRQEFDVLGDHDFNLRFLLRYDIGVLKERLAHYHWRHGSHGNTVTRARNTHRVMLNRLKNAYARQASMGGAVIDLSRIEFPGPDGAEPAPLRFRDRSRPEVRPMPELEFYGSGDVLSLDIFDTVLCRRFLRPTDVFQWLEREAVYRLQLPARPYALARRLAERLARQRAGSDTSEVGLEAIYEVLAELCDLDAAVCDSLLNLEVELENATLFADPRWLKIYRRLRSEGRRVLFISDMYHRSATLRGWLESRGFEDPEVYVSWEQEASKHLGTLQVRVQQQLGLEPGAILHMGDNRHSDYFQSLRAGWRALHWTVEHNRQPWFTEVPQHAHVPGDLLSSRIMGELERSGILSPDDDPDLLVQLGREVAGPLYLIYMRWVLLQAQQDGVRRLILLGRDGYYWEKTLQLLPPEEWAGLEFVYLPSSRKVLNFASFQTVDDIALEFLLTPNPSLRVRDFLDRTCLDSQQHLEAIAQAGFSDPDQVLTNESGGRFLDPQDRQRLVFLFSLLKPHLERLFAEDRRGVLESLERAGWDPADSALVDIGWTGSSVRPMQRLFGSAEVRVRAFFFGSWQEAEPVARQARLSSFFVHLGQPFDRFQLLRESVNLLESLHAAPHPPLIAFETRDGKPVARHAPALLGGFNADQQARIWRGAEGFLKEIVAGGLPPAGPADGLCYADLILQRFLREPYLEEVQTWGALQHSDGFGIEVYKPLMDPASAQLEGEPLLQAYHASSWKRGFLTTLTPEKRQFVIERVFPKVPRTLEELRAAYDFKCRQTDEFWSEKERYKWESGHFRKEVDRLSEVIAGMGKEAAEREQEAERSQEEARHTMQHLRKEIEQQQHLIQLREDQAGALREHIHTLQLELKQEADDLAELRRQRKDIENTLQGQREARRTVEQNLKASEQERQVVLQELQETRQQLLLSQERLRRLQAILKDRPALLRVFLTGRVVGLDADTSQR